MSWLGTLHTGTTEADKVAEIEVEEDAVADEHRLAEVGDERRYIRCMLRVSIPAVTSTTKEVQTSIPTTGFTTEQVQRILSLIESSKNYS